MKTRSIAPALIAGALLLTGCATDDDTLVDDDDAVVEDDGAVDDGLEDETMDDMDTASS